MIELEFILIILIAIACIGLIFGMLHAVFWTAFGDNAITTLLDRFFPYAMLSTLVLIVILMIAMMILTFPGLVR